MQAKSPEGSGSESSSRATAPEAASIQNSGRMKTGVGKVMTAQKAVNQWKDVAQFSKYLQLYHYATCGQLQDEQRAESFKRCWDIRYEVVDDCSKVTAQTAWLMMALENEFENFEEASTRLKEFLETQVPAKSYSDENWKRPSNLVQAFQQKASGKRGQATGSKAQLPLNASSNHRDDSDVAGRPGKPIRSNQEYRNSKARHNSELRLELAKDDIEMFGQAEAGFGRLDDEMNQDEARPISGFRKVSQCVVNFFKRLWNRIQS